MSNALQEGLKRAASKTKAPVKGKAIAQAGRAGTVMIGGHFPPAVKSSLLMIRVKHPDKTLQELLDEALNLLFEKYKVPQAARVR